MSHEVSMIEIKNSEILPLSMKHNFWTWSAQNQVDPIPVERAEGVYFWDTDGKQYLDFNSMTMCSNMGHGDQRIIQAIQRQAGELAYANPKMATKPRAILGKILSNITPGNLNRFLYTLGGADANENAIKIARAYTGRHKILTRYRSYHGATFGAMALTGDPRRWSWEPSLMSGVVHFLDPYRYRSTFHRTNPDISENDFSLDYLNHLDEIIMYEGSETIAAILIETVTGTNGILIPPAGYLEGIRTICDHYEILLICDEVMSGFGRTGRWFAVDHWNVIPDMITMAKGLTSGYAPLGAVAMRDEIAEFFNDRPYIGGLTFNGHPISLAAAIANIQAMEESQVIEHVQMLAPSFRHFLVDIGENHPSVGDIRSIGFFGVIELVRNQKSKEPIAPFNSSSKEMQSIQKHLIDQGVFLYTHWNTLLIIPPLIITEDQLKQGFSVIDEALDIADASLDLR
jgi:taurine--2-oxoglutarate transaminase